MRFRVFALALAAVVAAASASFGHLDTLMQIQAPQPLVKEFEAEACPGIPAEAVVADPLATGGKAVNARAGSPVFRVDFGKLEQGCYVVYVIAKVTEPTAYVADQLKPMYVRVRLLRAGNPAEEVICRVPFAETFEDVAHVYFHVPFAAPCTAEVSLAEPGQVAAVVDRIQLRDALGGAKPQALKTRRTHVTDDEVARLRRAATHEARGLYKPLRETPLTWEERQRLDDFIWNNMTPMNANYAGRQLYYGIERDKAYPPLFEQTQAKLGRKLGAWESACKPRERYDEPFLLVNKELNLRYTMEDYHANRPFPEPWPFREDKGGIFFDKETWGTERSFNHGVIPAFMRERFHVVTAALRGDDSSLAWRYLVHNDWAAAEDGAFLLAAFAYRYCGYDFRAHCMAMIYRNNKSSQRFHPGHMVGTGTAYTGWSREDVCGVLRSYDMLFPYIRGNQQLAQRVGRFIPWVREPDDVLKLIDTYLVQVAGQDGFRHNHYSPIIPWAAATLGPNPVAEDLLKRYFTRAYLRDALGGFGDSIVNGYSRDGLNYIGSTYYTQGESEGELGEIANLIGRYVALGGNKQFNVADPKRYPHLAALADSILDLYVAGGYGSNLGDVASPTGPARYNPEPKASPDLYLDAWRRSRSPRLAWVLKHLVGTQGKASNQEWDQIAVDAANTRSVTLHKPSRFLAGFGLAVMEEGQDSADLREKQAVTIRTGVATGHAHPDTLDLQFYALGLRMLSDIGGRLMGSYGKPSCMSTYVHNLVEVDEKSHSGGPVNSTGIGWLRAFKTAPGAQFTLAEGRAETHPHVSLYRRGVALVTVDEGGPNAYVFDVFRVRGGKTHTWCFHGCPPDDFAVNSGLAEAKSETALRYLAKHRPGSQKEGVAPAVLDATWRLRRQEEKVQIGDKEIVLFNAEKDMLEKKYDPKLPPASCRATLLGRAGDKVMVGNWYCTAFKGREFDWPFLYVRGEGQDRLETVWPSVIQAYRGEPVLTGIRQVPVEAAAGADAAVAVEVKTRGGRVDLLFSDGRPDAVRQVGDHRMSGEFAFASSTGAAHMVGGTELAHRGEVIRADRAAHEAVIESVDAARLRLRVRGDLPDGLLDGQQVLVWNDRHSTNARVASCKLVGQGRYDVEVDRTMLIYQGGVARVDAEGGHAVLDLPPSLYDYHPTCYEGMTVVNERGQVLGKATITVGGRYMYLGFPDWHRHTQRVLPADLVDANGDGKKTLRMFAAAKAFKRTGEDAVQEVAVGEPMLDLEVERVSEDGLTIFYKDHPMEFLDSVKVPHRGWPYHEQVLRNESGTRQWVSKLPGDVYHLRIEGRKLTAADFPDADGNGRPQVSLWDFGPGDRLRAPTHVAVRPVGDGVMELLADTGVTIVSAAKAVHLSADGKEWKDAPAQQAGDARQFRIDPAALAGGRTLVRMAR